MVDVAWEKGVDSSSIVYQQLKNSRLLYFINPTKKDPADELSKGRIAAIINVVKNPDSQDVPYTIQLRTSTASQRDYATLQSALGTIIHSVDTVLYPNKQTAAIVKTTEVTGRKYKMIDFFLPGMIGFSLIGTAVFGVAFLFYSLRETLVLKRMYSTPIRREYIILGESLSKVIFQLLTVIILIAFGHFVYGFYLSHGFLTFLNMLLLSVLGLLVFMGFGFFISAVAKNQNVIPIYANLFMFPQYFLSGTFFPKSSLPAGMQPIIKFLPLTALNDSMRNVAFEGATLSSCWPQITVLVVWGIIIYIATAKVFRWDL